jgi:hypothetical protein
MRRSVRNSLRCVCTRIVFRGEKARRLFGKARGVFGKTPRAFAARIIMCSATGGDGWQHQ